MTLDIFAVDVTDATLTTEDPRRLVADDNAALSSTEVEIETPDPGGHETVTVSFEFAEPAMWTPESPSLLCLARARCSRSPGAGAAPAGNRARADQGMAVPSQPMSCGRTFGLRHISVDPGGPRVLLNGEPVFLQGVGIHGETLEIDSDGSIVGGTPVQSLAHLRAELADAAAMGGHAAHGASAGRPSPASHR